MALAQLRREKTIAFAPTFGSEHCASRLPPRGTSDVLRPRRARAPDARGVSFLVAAIERETRGGRGLHLGAPAFEAGGRCASLPRHLHADGPRDRG